MKIKKSIIALLMTVALTSTFFAGCSSSNQENVTQINKKVVSKFQPAFTDISFENSEEEMLGIEGKAIEEYPSFYKGTVYRFPNKSYCNLDGSVKYMTDDQGKIACIAWLYESDDSESISTAYETIHTELVKKYGESGNASEAQGTFGDIWYFDDVHIQISAVITTDYKGMQVSYMDAAYSLKDEVDKKKEERKNN